jgi:CheY-like chemotaxis protein
MNDHRQDGLLKFLLVEDDDDHAAFVLRTLQRNRVANRVDRVADGATALAYLRGEAPYTQRPRPDLVLLDLKLPRVDGHEVLAAIKSHPDLRTIPVVVLTTSDAETDRARAYRNHANSYLVKPINFARFRQLVHDLSLYWGIWNRCVCPEGERHGRPR